jgi:hypothetical protein
VNLLNEALDVFDLPRGSGEEGKKVSSSTPATDSIFFLSFRDCAHQACPVNFDAGMATFSLVLTHTYTHKHARTRTYTGSQSGSGLPAFDEAQEAQ